MTGIQGRGEGGGRGRTEDGNASSTYSIDFVFKRPFSAAALAKDLCGETVGIGTDALFFLRWGHKRTKRQPME